YHEVDGLAAAVFAVAVPAAVGRQRREGRADGPEHAYGAARQAAFSTRAVGARRTADPSGGSQVVGLLLGEVLGVDVASLAVDQHLGPALDDLARHGDLVALVYLAQPSRLVAGLGPDVELGCRPLLADG